MGSPNAYDSTVYGFTFDTLEPHFRRWSHTLFIEWRHCIPGTPECAELEAMDERARDAYRTVDVGALGEMMGGDALFRAARQVDRPPEGAAQQRRHPQHLGMTLSERLGATLVE